MPLNEGIRLRGGSGSNVNKVAEWLRNKPIGEVANLAGEGNREAQTAIKILKQAATKGQNY